MRNASVGTMTRFICLVLLVAAFAPALAAVDSAPPPPGAPAGDATKAPPPPGDLPKADEPKKEEPKPPVPPETEKKEPAAAPPALSLRITAPKCLIEIWDKGQHIVYKEEDDGSVKVTVEGDGDKIETTAKDRKSFLEKYPDIAKRVGIEASRGFDPARRWGGRKGGEGGGAPGGTPGGEGGGWRTKRPGGEGGGRTKGPGGEGGEGGGRTKGPGGEGGGDAKKPEI